MQNCFSMRPIYALCFLMYITNVSSHTLNGVFSIAKFEALVIRFSLSKIS